MTMRRLPGYLEPGDAPVLASPDDVIAWVQAVDWLVASERAILLHLDADSRLTCVASAHGRFQWIGLAVADAWAFDALECAATAVVAVDLRPKLTPKSPSTVDLRRHRKLWHHLALYGVALIDSVLVTPDEGVSVTRLTSYPSGIDPSWLQLHSPRPWQAPGIEATHESAASVLASPQRFKEGRKKPFRVVPPPD
jgi:hypothetical protein